MALAQVRFTWPLASLVPSAMLHLCVSLSGLLDLAIQIDEER